MYTSFYKLTGKPFQLSPDPRFFYGSSAHRRAMSYLRYGLSQAEGFIVITGGIGTGKTTLVRNLFEELDRDEVMAAQLVTTQLDADDMLQLVVAAFGLEHEKLSKAVLIKRLEDFLAGASRDGKRVLLVVDEAQNLPAQSLEELRMLSNFQVSDKPLLQSFLLGQEEFRSTLQAPGLEQLRQRIIASCHLAPLEERETRISGEAVRFTVRADSLPLELAAIMFGNLEDVTGFARGEVRARGSLKALQLAGAADLVRGAASLPGLGVRFSGITGPVQFQGTDAILDSLPVTSSAGGLLSVSGAVDLTDLTNVGFDVDLRATRFGAIRRQRMNFLLSGNAHLGGTYAAPELTGDFRISNGTVRADQFFRDRSVVDLSDPAVIQFIDTTLVAERRLVARAQNPFLRNLRVDATMSVGPNLWLRSQQLELDMGGTLRVTMNRAQQDMQVVGPLSLERGRFRYEVGPYSRNFKITSGSIDFIGTPGVNPNLDINAEYETRTTRGVVLTVTLHVTGTMLEPSLSLSSDPQLAESDLVCYVFFGSPCVAVTGTQGSGAELGTQLARDQVLGTVSSSLSSVLVGETGLDFLDIRSGASVRPYGTSTASESFFSDTEVEIGKYLSRDVFVSVRQAIGRAVPPAVRVEYKFGSGWTAVARTERYLSDQLIRNYSNFTTKQLVGVSLFREWDF